MRAEPVLGREPALPLLRSRLEALHSPRRSAWNSDTAKETAGATPFGALRFHEMAHRAFHEPVSPRKSRGGPGTRG
jgi:hypothetical protein